MTICFPEVLVLVYLILCLPSQGNPEKSDHAECKIEQHFHSSVMTPMAEEMAEVTGCSAKISSRESKEVYVLSLLNAGFKEPRKVRTGYNPSVYLHIRPHWKQRTFSTNTVIILHSTMAVMWHVNLEHVKNSTSFNIIVNKPSIIVPSSSVPLSREKIPLKKKLSSWIISRYGAITSFSVISMANEITLFIGSDTYMSSDCNINSTAQSENVEATFVQPRSASGCDVYNNSTNKRSWHLYVVELNLTKPNQNVLVHLQSHIESRKTSKLALEQNLILVLKCHVPMTWIIESAELQGSVLIQADYPVRIRTNPKHITAVVQKRSLPSDTALLLNEVQNSLGSIDSFIKTRNANRVNIFVKEKSTNDKETNNKVSSKLTSNKQPYSPESDVQETLPYAFPKGSLSQMLFKPLVLECLENEIRIVFPFEKIVDILTSAIGENHKLLSISFFDTKCKAEINGIHIVLHSGYEECGTQSFYDEDRLIYHNQVQIITSRSANGSDSKKKHFISDDDDLSDNGSGSDEPILSDTSTSTEHTIYPIPFHCKNRPATSIQSSFIKKYEMNIFLKKDFLNPIATREFPLKMAPNDYIFVEAVIDADPRICLIVEECWITERKDVEFPTNKQTVLIKKGCATDLSVGILSNSSCKKQVSGVVPHLLRFSFQLNDKFRNQNLYLKCFTSACASTNSTQLGLKQCIDAENFCIDQSLRPYLNLQSGKRNIVSRGPFHVAFKSHAEKVKVESSSPENFVDYSFDKLTGTSKKNALSPQLILVGLSTEAVVGIAFASFIIGAGLMASLWLIHMHTEPSRRLKNRKSISKQDNFSYQCSNQLKYDDPIENAENFVPHSARPISLRIGS